MPRKLLAFYDASGSEADRNRSPILVAGLVSTDRRGGRFHADWSEVLRRYQVPYLHMREFTSFQGPFSSGWRGEVAEQSSPMKVGSVLMRPLRRCLIAQCHILLRLPPHPPREAEAIACAKLLKPIVLGPVDDRRSCICKLSAIL